MTPQQQIVTALRAVQHKPQPVQINGNYELFIKRTNLGIVVYHIDREVNLIFDRQTHYCCMSDEEIDKFSEYVFNCVENNLSASPRRRDNNGNS